MMDQGNSAELLPKKSPKGKEAQQEPFDPDVTDVTFVQPMREEILKEDNVNVIILEWSKGAAGSYAQASANSRLAGAEIAHLVRFLERSGGTRRELVHLMGHSLGAHLVGYTGHRLGGRVGRITGLDPSGPLFISTDPLVRLDPTDAKFVDVIHTNGAGVINIALGMYQPLGHVDFYPNGGKFQSDCYPSHLLKRNSSGLQLHGQEEAFNCHHGRVTPLMRETVSARSPCRFKAFPCNSYEDFQDGRCLKCGDIGCANMGYWADQWDPKGRTNVAMFLDTEGQAGFCRFHYAFRVTTSISQPRARRVRLYAKLEGSNGVSGDLSLFKDPVWLEAGKSYNFLVLTQGTYGELEKLVFRFRDWPPSGQADGNAKIFMREVVVSSGETEKE